MSDEPEVPPEFKSLENMFRNMLDQSRADSIGNSRMQLAIHIFDIMAAKFLKSARFNPHLVELAVDYTDELIAELKKPLEGS